MQVSEIHAAAEERVGKTLLRTSVKAALAAGSAKDPPHFKWVRHGVYRRAVLGSTSDPQLVEPASRVD